MIQQDERYVPAEKKVLKVRFYPSSVTVGTKKLTFNSGSTKIDKIPLPKFGSRMNIYVDEDGLKDKKSLVATVNLDRLGFLVNLKRHFGSISHLYVMELPDQRQTRVAAAA